MGLNQFVGPNGSVVARGGSQGGDVVLGRGRAPRVSRVQRWSTGPAKALGVEKERVVSMFTVRALLPGLSK